MSNYLCAVCGKELPEDPSGAPPVCRDCRRVTASANGGAANLPVDVNLSARGSLPTGRNTRDWNRPHRSLWLRAAGILLLLTIGFVGVYAVFEPPGAKGKFVWWVTLPALFGIFGAMVLAVIGLQDLSRTDAQRRPSLAEHAKPELPHRWGRTIFRGAGILAAICCIISVVLVAASGLPVLMGVAMSLVLLAIVAAVASILYFVIVGPRVAYFAVVGFFHRGEPTVVG